MPRMECLCVRRGNGREELKGRLNPQLGAAPLVIFGEGVTPGRMTRLVTLQAGGIIARRGKMAGGAPGGRWRARARARYHSRSVEGSLQAPLERIEEGSRAAGATSAQRGVKTAALLREELRMWPAPRGGSRCECSICWIAGFALEARGGRAQSAAHDSR